MSEHIRGGVLLGLLALSAACSNEVLPTNPASTTGVLVQPAAPVSIEPGSYQFSAPLSPSPVSGYTATSKYVLLEGGAFLLQRTSGGRDLAGTYRSESGPLAGYVTFQFTGTSWEATAAVKGDLLEVRYNTAAWGADFEDAVYKRTP
jgi:hypothetical protein